MGKLITLDGDGRLVPTGDEVRRPKGEEGRSSAPQPTACEPDAPRRLDDRPGRDAVRVAGKRILWAGPGPAEAWR
jgi:hypothetical protein